MDNDGCMLSYMQIEGRMLRCVFTISQCTASCCLAA